MKSAIQHSHCREPGRFASREISSIEQMFLRSLGRNAHHRPIGQGYPKAYLAKVAFELLLSKSVDYFFLPTHFLTEILDHSKRKMAMVNAA